MAQNPYPRKRRGFNQWKDHSSQRLQQHKYDPEKLDHFFLKKPLGPNVEIAKRKIDSAVRAARTNPEYPYAHGTVNRMHLARDIESLQLLAEELKQPDGADDAAAKAILKGLFQRIDLLHHQCYVRAKSISLPPSIRGETAGPLAERYRSQIAEMFAGDVVSMWINENPPLSQQPKSQESQPDVQQNPHQDENAPFFGIEWFNQRRGDALITNLCSCLPQINASSARWCNLVGANRYVLNPYVSARPTRREDPVSAELLQGEEYLIQRAKNAPADSPDLVQIPGGHWWWEEELPLLRGDLPTYLSRFTNNAHILLLLGKSKQLDSCTWASNELISWVGAGNEACIRERQLHRTMMLLLQQLDGLKRDASCVQASWIKGGTTKNAQERFQQNYAKDYNKIKPMWALFKELENEIETVQQQKVKARLKAIVADMHSTFDMHANTVVNSTNRVLQVWDKVVEAAACVSSFRRENHRSGGNILKATAEMVYNYEELSQLIIRGWKHARAVIKAITGFGLDEPTLVYPAENAPEFADPPAREADGRMRSHAYGANEATADGDGEETETDGENHPEREEEKKECEEGENKPRTEEKKDSSSDSESEEEDMSDDLMEGGHETKGGPKGGPEQPTQDIRNLPPSKDQVFNWFTGMNPTTNQTIVIGTDVYDNSGFNRRGRHRRSRGRGQGGYGSWNYGNQHPAFGGYGRGYGRGNRGGWNNRRGWNDDRGYDGRPYGAGGYDGRGRGRGIYTPVPEQQPRQQPRKSCQLSDAGSSDAGSANAKEKSAAKKRPQRAEWKNVKKRILAEQDYSSSSASSNEESREKRRSRSRAPSPSPSRSRPDKRSSRRKDSSRYRKGSDEEDERSNSRASDNSGDEASQRRKRKRIENSDEDDQSRSRSRSSAHSSRRKASSQRDRKRSPSSDEDSRRKEKQRKHERKERKRERKERKRQQREREEREREEREREERKREERKREEREREERERKERKREERKRKKEEKAQREKQQHEREQQEQSEQVQLQEAQPQQQMQSQKTELETELDRPLQYLEYMEREPVEENLSDDDDAVLQEDEHITPQGNDAHEDGNGDDNQNLTLAADVKSVTMSLVYTCDGFQVVQEPK